MTTSNKILSEITIFNKYAKYNPDLKRRETWDEICNRYELMMISKYPNLQSEITNSMEFVRSKRVLPSMRAMQFAGTPIFKNESRIYNCAYLPVDDYRAFNESMFLLLGGTGVGFSVQKHHIDKLPPISKPTKEKKYMIADSLEGWADAIKVLVKSYFGYNQYKPKFNYTDIRNKGMRLITAGGKAPGPEPLKIALTHLEAIFERKQNGDKLTSLDCHDIMCHIADAVLSGGIRRSAMISLFSHDDYDMMECKFGNWWELNPQRGRANNSAVLEREVVTEEKFKSIWKKIELSGSGEPGVYWTNNKDWGTNPCCFIGSTLVATADGRNAVTIKQLCNEKYQGPVYSMQAQTGQVVTSYCSKVWKSRENAELVRVLLDDSSSFTCTPDHRIMLRNGQYVQAQHLIEGTSLMPFNSYKRSDRNYRMIQSNTGRDIAQYAHVAQYYDIVKEGYNSQHIHHKDGNGLNDLPNNLEAIDAIEHNRQHMLGANNAFHKMSNKVREQWSEKQSSRQKGENNTNSNGLTTEEMITSCFDKTVQKRAKLSYQEVLDICCVKSLSKGRLKEMKAKTVSEFSEKLAELANHKVVSVEFISEREDVYDMTVEGTHNFAIITSNKDDNFITSSGVFVHNCEIALKPFQFCNLCEVNVSDIVNQEDLNMRVGVAAFFGTLQAGYTDFHYLRAIWRKTTEEDALIGVGMTGIASGKVLDLDLVEAADIVKKINKIISNRIKINSAARATTIKPSGTTSCVLGTSSGIHAWHNDYYFRRIRVTKNDPLYGYMFMYHNEIVEDDQLKSHDTAIITIPQEAPTGSILRTESVLDLLNRISKFNLQWVKEGHAKGDNANNVSATVSIKPEEWNLVGDWMYENRNTYNGISVLPYDNGSYIQAPFENCTKEQFDELSKSLTDIDLTKIVENDDNTEHSQELACAGGSCSIE